MKASALFLNQAGRLRSGWRLGSFTILLFVLMFLTGTLVRIGYVLAVLLRPPGTPSGYSEDLIFRFIFLASAIGAGWICNHWLEGLPWRALGLSFQEHWWRDLCAGSLIGGASLALAAGIACAAGGLRFAVSGREMYVAVLQTLVSTAVLFTVAALAEEALFRGYPLQTLSRAGLVWLAVLLTSLPFAAVHLQNPNVVAGFTFINTALAGVWLAVAYLRTRNLWFPLGVHWAWNWALGSIFGLPVSGITKLAPHPLLLASDHGPAWLTGGSYGIEGGLACTIALLLSTLFIWRTRLVSADAELTILTSQENPTRARSRQTSVPTSDKL